MIQKPSSILLLGLIMISFIVSAAPTHQIISLYSVPQSIDEAAAGTLYLSLKGFGSFDVTCSPPQYFDISIGQHVDLRGANKTLQFMINCRVPPDKKEVSGTITCRATETTTQEEVQSSTVVYCQQHPECDVGKWYFYAEGSKQCFKQCKDGVFYQDSQCCQEGFTAQLQADGSYKCASQVGSYQNGGTQSTYIIIILLLLIGGIIWYLKFRKSKSDISIDLPNM